MGGSELGWVVVEMGAGAARGGLSPPLGLFGLAMSPRSASHRLKHSHAEGIRDVSLPQL